MKNTDKFIRRWMPLILGMVLMAAPGHAGESVEYYNPAARVSLAYPSDWTAFDRGLSFGFISPRTEERYYVSSVNIIVAPVFGVPTDENDIREIAEERIRERLPSARFLAFGPAYLDGKPAHQMLFTTTKGMTQLLFYQIFAVHEGIAYFLIFSADLNLPEDVFFADLTKAKELVNSFRTES